MTTTDIFSASSRTVLEYQAEIYPDGDEDLTIWPLPGADYLAFTANRLIATATGDTGEPFANLVVEVTGNRIRQRAIIGDVTYSATDTPLDEAPDFLIDVVRDILPTGAHHLLPGKS